MGYSSTAVAMMLPAWKRDEHNGVTGCTLCAWPSVFRRKPGCAAGVRHPGEHQLSLTDCYYCYPPLAPKATNRKHRQDSGRLSARGGCCVARKSTFWATIIAGVFLPTNRQPQEACEAAVLFQSLTLSTSPLADSANTRLDRGGSHPARLAYQRNAESSLVTGILRYIVVSRAEEAMRPTPVASA